MATRNVVLTDRQETVVAGLVASGRYRSASEATGEGLRLLEMEEAAINELSSRLANGVQQARDGEFADGNGTEAISRAFAKARNR